MHIRLPHILRRILYQKPVGLTLHIIIFKYAQIKNNQIYGLKPKTITDHSTRILQTSLVFQRECTLRYQLEKITMFFTVFVNQESV